MQASLKNKINKAIWCVSILIVICLFAFGFNARKNSICSNVEIEIANTDGSFFINKDDVLNQVEKFLLVNNTPIKNINTSDIELYFKQNPWAKNVEVYVDNNNKVHININQRKPIARLYTLYNTNYYLDESGFRMPPNNATARVLIISGFPSDNNPLAKIDSNVLSDVTQISNYIIRDSFFNAQISQIHITSTGNYILYPTIGNHTIEFGNADDYESKFKRLYAFYTKAWIKEGIDTYEKIDVRFNNQVVATKKGTSAVISDSLRVNIDSIFTKALDTLL